MSGIDKPTLENIRVFLQHGFKPGLSLQGKQARGNCVFCLKGDHFYLNIESLQWDCKVCGKAGGWRQFLSELSSVCAERFRHQPALKLATNRGLSHEKMRSLGIGWNPVNNSYTIPYRGTDGSLFDLRHYPLGEKVMSSKGTTSGLFNLPDLTDDKKIIYLCEGEWDTIALLQSLDECGMKEATALGVPGAAMFKDEWTGFFRDREIVVCYDNDEAGVKGAGKVFNKIRTVVKTIRFLTWGVEKEGYDVRDLFIDKGKSGKTLLRAIGARLSEFPKGFTDASVVGEKDKTPTPHDAIPVEEVYKAYEKWLWVPDRMVIDVMFGTIFANRFPGDPIWMFIVAPPGGTKTEFLMSLSDANGIMTTTALTPHSLVSGASFAAGGDPSLIPRLNNKVLIVKDFTTILEMPSMVRDEIFGILRDAYDGKTEKFFGNGVFRRYESKFGIMAGVTPAIDQYTEGHSALGERFLRFRLRKIDNPSDIIRRALGNNNKEVEMRKELRGIAAKVLSFPGSAPPTTSPEIIEKIIHLSCFTALLRGTVHREKYTNEITFRPFSELGTRLGKQFMKLAGGIGIFRGVDAVGEYEYQVIKRTAICTIADRINKTVQTLFVGEKPMTGQEVSDSVGLPVSTIGRLLENMALLGVAQREKGVGFVGRFALTQKIKTHIKGAEIYE